MNRFTAALWVANHTEVHNHYFFEYNMTSNRSKTSTSMTQLFVFVTLAMVVTSIVKADNYLFGDPAVLTSDMNLAKRNTMTFHNTVLPSSKNSWLMPGSSGVRTSFKGGMAHFQFDSKDEGDVSDRLPGNTRFVFSMGMEENELTHVPGSASFNEANDWTDRYSPMLYLTVGHSW